MSKSLNQKQKNAIEILITNPYIKKGELAKECDVCDNTITAWFKNELFLETWDQRLKEEWKNSIRKAQRQMESLAERGDFKACQYILDAGGFKTAEKLEISSEDGININVNIV